MRKQIMQNLLLCAIAGLALLAPPLQSQAGTSFAAASIRPVDVRKAGFRPMQADPAGFHASGVHLLNLIGYAYGAPPEHIVGSPQWVWQTTFAIDAATSKPATTAELRAMLRALLAQRFGLRLQRELRTMPMYALVVVPGGPKLHSLAFGEQPTEPRARGGKVAAFVCQTIDQLIDGLNFEYQRGELSRPVVDQTGLSGRYSIVPLVDPVLDASGRHQVAVSEVPAALKRQYGLELKPEIGSVVYYKFVSAHMPTPN